MDGLYVGPYAFYKNIRFLVPAIFMVATAFLVWDEFFTIHAIWGFNPDYLQGLYLGSLPIEEVLFFFIIPYCCVFIYEVLIAYFPNVSLQTTTKIVSLIIVLFGTTLALTHLDNWYTLSACALAVLIVVFGMQGKYIWYPRAIFAFLVAQLPFLIVNGFLTAIPVVQYNDAENLGIRIYTIPFEDAFYGMLLVLMNIAIYEKVKSTHGALREK